jgi:hypothetical protein
MLTPANVLKQQQQQQQQQCLDRKQHASKLRVLCNQCTERAEKQASTVEQLTQSISHSL